MHGILKRSCTSAANQVSVGGDVAREDKDFIDFSSGEVDARGSGVKRSVRVFIAGSDRGIDPGIGFREIVILIQVRDFT